MSNPKDRAKDYRRRLASLSEHGARTALACYLFSSIHQKQNFLAALTEVEKTPPGKVAP